MGDQVTASAILDMIRHHCTVINIKAESYRLRDRRKGSPPSYKEK
jgi:DNA replication protein DnaC